MMSFELTSLEGNVWFDDVTIAPIQIERDSLALVALYNSTNGANWTNNTNWLTGPVSTWYGITVTNGRVTGVGLANNNLTGPLPAAIGDLDSLQTLILSHNYLSGEIPLELWTISTLRDLQMRFNGLSGTLSPDIGNLVNLVTIDIIQNEFSGAIPSTIGNLSHLVNLVLEGNQFSGDIPPELWTMTSLQSIAIGQNLLTGSIPAAIGNLTNLSFFSAGNNQLSGGIPPEISALPSIGAFYVEGNNLSGPIPPEFYQTTSLQHVTLGYNQLTGTISPSIGNLVNLIDFRVYGNNLTGEIPQEIGRLTNLQIMYFGGNQFTGAVPDSIVRCQNLSILSISDNQFDGLPDLSSLTALSELSVNNNRLGFEDLEPNMGIASSYYAYAPQDSIGVARDTVIILDQTLVLEAGDAAPSNQYQWKKNGVNIPGATGNTHTIVSAVFSSAAVYTCDITNTTVTGLTLSTRPVSVSVVPSPLQQDSLALVALYNSTNGPNWTNKTNWLTGPVSTWFGITVSGERVTIIDLRQNNLVGILPQAVGDLSAVTYFHLGWNSLSGPLPSSISGLANVSELFWADNQFTGSIPPEIGSLPRVSQIILSGNQLSGSLPNEMGNLSTLQVLILSSNQLSGTLSPWIGNFPELSDIRLNDNTFSGALPQEIGRLANLGRLQIRNNVFSGAIPDSIIRLPILAILDLGNNGFTALPNLSSLTNLQDLVVDNNQLTFEDLEPNVGVASSLFSYVPQDSVGVAESRVAQTGEAVTITTTIGGSANVYEWRKNGAVIPGQTGATLDLGQVSTADNGTYTCAVTNTSVPGLTIYRRPVTVSVSPTAGIPFISAITPLQGPVGTSVTISGTNFSATASDNIVRIGGIRATVSAAAQNSLTVTVPPGASYGRISVTVAGKSYTFQPAFSVATGSPGAVTSSSFLAKTDVATLSQPRSVLAADLDNDGRNDLAIASFGSNTIEVFRNIHTTGPLGPSSFATRQLFAAGTNPWKIVAGDLDGDGRLDLVTSNHNASSLTVYRNTSSPGSITLAPPVTLSTTSATQVTIADIDLDGRPDLVTTSMNGDLMSVFRNQSTGSTLSFAPKVDFSSGDLALAVGAGDLTGDGKPDVVVTSNSTANTSIFVYRNICTPGVIDAGTFDTPMELGTDTSTTGVALGDIDGDGKPDILVVNSFGGDANIQVLRNTGTGGAFSVATPYTFMPGGIGAETILLTDINGDGKPDPVTTTGNAIAVFQNTSAPGSVALSPQVTFAAGVSPYGAAAADLNNDGRVDLVTANYNAQSLSIFEAHEPAYVEVPGEYTPDGNTRLLLHMNEAAGTLATDASGNGNDGTSLGTPGVTGRFGKGRTNDQLNTSIIVQHDASLDVGTSPFTLEAWVNVQLLGDAIFVLFQKLQTSPSVRGYELTYDHSSAKRFILNMYWGSTFQDKTSLIVPYQLMLNTWYHIAAEIAPTTAAFYVNGALIQSAGSLPTGSLDNSASLRIYHESGNVRTAAVFDEVRLSDVARSPQAFNLQLPPVNLTASSTTPSRADLSWSNGGGALPLMKYYIYRGLDSVTTVRIDSTTMTTYQDNTAAAASTYFYRVAAVDSTGFEGAKSFAAQVTILSTATAPPAPVGVTATPVSSKQIDLTWTDNASNEDGFRIERKTGVSGAWSEISVRPANTTSYSDTGLTPSTQYSYRMRAYNAAGTSTYSNEAPATTQAPPTTVPGAPSGLMAQVVSSSQIDLMWIDNATDEDGYRIERKIGAGGSYSQVAVVGVNVTSYQSKGLTSGTQYFYRVRAYNAAGNSTYSNEAQATTQTVQSAPAAPTQLTTTNISTNQISLSWIDNASNEDRFLLERKTGAGGTYAQIAMIGVDTTSFVNTGLTPGTLYMYRVRASNTAGTSVYSNEVQATTLTSDVTAPSSPLSVQITPTTWSRNALFTVSWTNPTDPSGISAAWYSVNTQPSVMSPGTRVQITTPNLPVTMTTAGTSVIYFYLEDGLGNNDPNTAVAASARYDPESPVIVHDSSAVAAFDSDNPQSIPIIVTAADGLSNMAQLFLQYRRSGTAWSGATTGIYASLSGGEVAIPGSFITQNMTYGVDYRIVAEDVAGNVATSSVHSIRIKIATPVTRRDPSGNPVTQPSLATLQAGQPEVYAYRMFSVPLNLDNKTPKDIFENHMGLSGYNIEQWRFFAYNRDRAASDPFDEYPAISTSAIISPGRAFFLILRAGIVVKTGPGSVIRADSLSRTGIQLQSGYNFVGNPLNTSIPIDSLSLANGTSLAGRIWQYVGAGGTNSGWSPNPTELKPWEGIVIDLGAGAPTTLMFNIAERTSSAARGEQPTRAISTNASTGESWMMRLSATRDDNRVVDCENIIGVAPLATDGIDANDLTEPPFIGSGMISIGFLNETTKLTHDFREGGKRGYVWDLELRTDDQRIPVDLVLENAEASGMRVFLFDLDTRMAFDVQRDSSVRVNSGNGSKMFRLVVGDLAFVTEHSDGIDVVPKSVMLYQNYPNPFNPETIIRFSLPGEDDVRLCVYDILGREIRIVLDRTMPAGYHEERFDASGLSAGLYLIRLETTQGTESRKMILLK